MRSAPTAPVQVASTLAERAAVLIDRDLSIEEFHALQVWTGQTLLAQAAEIERLTAALADAEMHAKSGERLAITFRDEWKAALARAEALEKLVRDCQDELATWIVPDSGISYHDVLSALLGKLDGPQSRSIDAARARAEAAEKSFTWVGKAWPKGYLDACDAMGWAP